jgi:hypothetical protein
LLTTGCGGGERLRCRPRRLRLLWGLPPDQEVASALDTDSKTTRVIFTDHIHHNMLTYVYSTDNTRRVSGVVHDLPCYKPVLRHRANARWHHSPLSTLDTSWLSSTVSSSSVVRRLSSLLLSRRPPLPRGPPKCRGGRSLTRSSTVSGVWWRDPANGQVEQMKNDVATKPLSTPTTPNTKKSTKKKQTTIASRCQKILDKK